MIRKWAVAIVLCITAALIAGCASKPSKDQAEAVPEQEIITVPLDLPATFTATIPCADCLKVDISLNLRPDYLYQLRKTFYQDKGNPRVEAQMRSYRYDHQESLIVLGKEKGALKTYRIMDGDTLRFLDIEGEEIEELINYDLKRQDEPDPFHDVVKMRGMFSSTGNNHFFSECSSGNTFPVDPSGKFYELDRSYRNIPHPTGHPMLVSIKGKLIQTGMRHQKRDLIIVEGFHRIYPDRDCTGTLFEKSLFGVTWEAVEINGLPVEKNEMGAKPFIILEARDKKVRGNTGCNRFFGSYFFKGEVFIFNNVASTRMACPGMLLTEDSFLRAMDRTESYIMEKGLLIFKDENDDPVMKMKAKY